jgi:hypothetical protein
MKMIETTCDNCGKMFQRREAEIKFNQRMGMKRAYCSRACWRASLHQSRQGPSNPNWNGGRYIRRDGYVEIRVDGVERLEHNYLMEKKMGRELKRGELVHHMNGIRTDNRMENLKLMTISEHMRIHHPKGILRRAKMWRCVICGRDFISRGARATLCGAEECRKEKNRQFNRESRAKRRGVLSVAS